MLLWTSIRNDKKKMRITWLDINASYAHASLALPAIHAQCTDPSVEWNVVRGTIGGNRSEIMQNVLDQYPDIIAFTAWLFNHEFMLDILARIKALLPSVTVIGGGPEYLGNNETLLRNHSFIDLVLRGEGEEAFYAWLSRCDRPEEWDTVPGLCWIGAEGMYHDNGMARVSDFAGLNPPEASAFFDWSKPFVQLESTRGCFNNCAFCVSGSDNPVRSLPVARMKERIDRLFARGVREIRMLDRTFNGSGNRAGELLALFASYAGKIRFHVELHPALLNEKVRRSIAALPPGVLHAEAGIQSLDDRVLAASGRAGKVADALDGLRFLCSQAGFETHADLIAGLPYYTFPQMVSDVRQLIGTGAAEVQLELLKLLPGTEMRRRAQELGIVYAPRPPYEVLRTEWIAPQELILAEKLSRLLDGYYNGSAWHTLFARLVLADPAFLGHFLFWMIGRQALDAPLSLEKRGFLLFAYCREHCPDMRDDLAVLWVKNGLSLKREVTAGIEPWSRPLPGNVRTEAGAYRSGMRLYRLPLSGGEYWFGFDRGVSHSAPLFVGKS